MQSKENVGQAAAKKNLNKTKSDSKSINRKPSEEKPARKRESKKDENVIYEDDADKPETNELRTIEICIGSISGLRPVYMYSEMSLKVEFQNECLLETEKMRMDDSVDINQVIKLNFNYDEMASFDKFVSNPIVLTVTETEGERDPAVDVPETNAGRALWMSEDSILDLEEALLGTRTQLDDKGDADSKTSKSLSKKSSSKSSKGSSKGGKKNKDKLGKSSKGSKTSKGSKGKKDKGKKPEPIKGEIVEPKPIGPQMAGFGTLDLLPLFLGSQEMDETIILKGDTAKKLDDRIRAAARLPRIKISVKVDKPIPVGKIFDFTVESIYNLPSVMSQNMKYELCFNIPSMQKRIINFDFYTYKSEPRGKFEFKKWFGSNQPSNYVLEDDYSGVKSSLEVPLEEVVTNYNPRLEYNVLKRNYATEDDVETIRLQLQKFRCLGVEIYMTKADKDAAKGDSAPKEKAPKKGGKEKDSKGGKKSKGKDGSGKGDEDKAKPEIDHLHLMAFVDLCRLIYPGQKSARIACPLRTYTYDEFESNAGLKDSYFRPKPPPPLPPTPAEPKSEKKKGGKDKKSKKSSSKKSSDKKTKGSKGKGSKGKKGEKGGNLAGKLPPPPPPKELSKPVYNEAGLPTFIIIDFQFREALVPPKEMQDLSSELQEILTESPACADLPKCIRTKHITEELFKDTIKSITKDMKLQYIDYLEEMDEAAKSNPNVKNNYCDFLQHLQQKGVYQTYLASITRAAAIYVNATYNYNPEDSTADYHIFISRVYVQLVEVMNTVMSELFRGGIDICAPAYNPNADLLKYAREALELGATGLANRYLLQRICDDETNADYWFDYAVYHMHMKEEERAMECTKEALKQNVSHKNSLVLYASLLARRKRIAEAETCLLNVTLHDPGWVEGWGALYCIYQRKNNPEGMEVTYELAEKNLKLRQKEPIGDLAWSDCIFPNTVFYRTAAYFITLRLYDEAEIMLAEEILLKPDGLNEYLLAVIDYYKKDFEHALLHADNALVLGGCDYAKASLKGHILANKDDARCALEEYQKIFELHSIPSDNYIYLVYIRSGLCLSKLGDDQKARLSFLHACKVQGSPYTWLCAGVLYYHQHDFLSAEECLTQSNSLDNRMPETWAYLALVNVKLNKAHEANMCYHQVKQHQLQNVELLVMLEDQINRINNVNNLT